MTNGSRRIRRAGRAGTSPRNAGGSASETATRSTLPDRSDSTGSIGGTITHPRQAARARRVPSRPSGRAPQATFRAGIAWTFRPASRRTFAPASRSTSASDISIEKPGDQGRDQLPSQVGGRNAPDPPSGLGQGVGQQPQHGEHVTEHGSGQRTYAIARQSGADSDRRAQSTKLEEGAHQRRPRSAWTRDRPCG